MLLGAEVLQITTAYMFRCIPLGLMIIFQVMRISVTMLVLCQRIHHFGTARKRGYTYDYYPDDVTGDGTNEGPGVVLISQAEGETSYAGIFRVRNDVRAGCWRVFFGSPTDYHHNNEQATNNGLFTEIWLGGSQGHVGQYTTVTRLGMYTDNRYRGDLTDSDRGSLHNNIIICTLYLVKTRDGTETLFR